METLKMVSLANLILLLGGIFLLILGLFQIFSKSWFNKGMEFMSKLLGGPVKGSDSVNKFGGVMLIIAGTFMLAAYLFIQQRLASFF